MTIEIWQLAAETCLTLVCFSPYPPTFFSKDLQPDTVRKRCEALNILTPKPILEHFNLTENGVIILDHGLNPPKGALIDLYFKSDANNRLQARCEYDETDDCRYVKFALDIPEVQEILQKKGWKT